MADQVLLIDDSPDIHELLHVLLSREGLVLHHSHSAVEGCRLAQLVRPDLILLDLDMPLVSGFEACAQLKANTATSHIPVVFLTGAGDIRHRVAGLDLGAVDYVSKPFDQTELLARIRAALRTKDVQDRLSRRAQIDPLTGLGNRWCLDRGLQDAVTDALRYARDTAVLLIDVDHFKQLNDAYGHPFGDSVLHVFGKLLTETAGTTDTACRYGGEEFALLMPNTNLEQGACAAERLRTGIAGLQWIEKGQVVRITSSMGLASTSQWTPLEDLTPSRLLAAVDTALYRAKRQGRNRLEMVTALDVANETLNSDLGSMVLSV